MPSTKNRKNLKQPNLPPKRIRKRKRKSKVSRKKEIINIREDINKIDFKKIEKKSKKKQELVL